MSTHHDGIRCRTQIALSLLLLLLLRACTTVDSAKTTASVVETTDPLPAHIPHNEEYRHQTPPSEIILTTFSSTYLQTDDLEFQSMYDDKESSNTTTRSDFQRRLSSSSATIGTFQPLTCNPPDLSTMTCEKLVTSILPSDPTQPLIIPCGECYLFDKVGDITVNGIDIRGRLHFPASWQNVGPTTIRTPYVIVQGELQMNVDESTKVQPSNFATRFILTGSTDDVMFDPTEAPNQGACNDQPGGKCNLGKKPFVIAGGKLNIKGGMPDTCSSFTPIKDVIFTDPNYATQGISCDELIVGGDAEGNSLGTGLGNTIPMSTNNRLQAGTLTVKEEIIEDEKSGAMTTNKYWNLSGRSAYHSSIKYTFSSFDCFTRGVTLRFSVKVRLHYAPGFFGRAEAFFWRILFFRHDNSIGAENIAECDAQHVRDGWVTCSSDFIVNEESSNLKLAYVEMHMRNTRDGENYDIDYDDFTLSFHKGYLKDIIVDSNDVSCWGAFSDVHVTSSTYFNWRKQKDNGFEAKIESVSDLGDGTAVITLDEAAILPVITEEDNPDYAVEIALLSRKIIVEGDNDEVKKGGYMQFLHTPDVAQTISGVEFVNMGRVTEVDKFAMQFLYSSDVHGTKISKSVFRTPNHRCISVEGTSNVTLSDNIGFHPYGHCFFLGYESADNSIEHNLVTKSKVLSAHEVVSGESDHRHVAAFINMENPNHFTDNVAVAGDSTGFLFDNQHTYTRVEDGSWISGSARYRKMGTFQRNTARSNASNGLKLSFHNSDEEVEMKGLKLIKNRSSGIAMYHSHHFSITDSVIAENSGINIEVNWMEKLRIEDTVIKGYTAETKALVKPPYFEKPCLSGGLLLSPVGIRLPTAVQYSSEPFVEANFTNVLFTGFDECAESMPITFRTADNPNMHFMYQLSFQNVNIDGKRKIDMKSADEEGVRDIIIHDIDGSSNPAGATSFPGMFVNNVQWLKKFAPSTCERYSLGVNYCPNTCYRTVTFMVDQTDPNFDIRVVRLSDRKDIYVSYTYPYDGDAHRKHYSGNFRLFPVSLPEGDYEVEFLSDMESAWPITVLQRWEGMPRCQGSVSPSNISLVEPKSGCNNLILNGDLRQGSYYWLHNNAREAKDGELLFLDGIGINNSPALKLVNRRNEYIGVGQNLDMRCIRSNVNEFYEIKVYFRLQQGSTHSVCIMNSMSPDDRCPSVAFSQEKYVDGEFKSEFFANQAVVVASDEMEEFSLLHGVIKVTESLGQFGRIFMHLTQVHSKYDIIVGNASVEKFYITPCGEELIRNGDFESNGLFWRFFGGAIIDIQSTSSSKSVRAFNRIRPYDGVEQRLFVSSKCFKAGDRYLIVGKFKIESKLNNNDVECDPSAVSGEFLCGKMYISTQSPIEDRFDQVAETVAVATSVSNGWSMMAGIMTVIEPWVDHDRMSIVLGGPHESMNVYFDDASIIHIPRKCDNLVLNSDFEEGDSRFWLPTTRHNIGVSMSAIESGSSKFAVAISQLKHFYTEHALRQQLDTRCIVEGQEYQINAKFKLVNPSDLTTGLGCDPTSRSVTDENHCPIVTIKGEQCDGNSLEYKFWNDIDFFQWDPDGFNNFQKDFTVNAELASCKTVLVLVGHYLFKNQVLLADEVRIMHTSTFSPTTSPTFSPTTETETNSQRPTRKTEAPTTKNFVSCPPIGSSPQTITSGSYMLNVANDQSLCSLTKVLLGENNKVINRIPIARSYNSSPWERSPGELSFSIFGSSEIRCYSIGCQVNLPESEEGTEYHLNSYTHTLSKIDEYSRFLESATYGVTQADLDLFDVTNIDVETQIINWMKEQMNTTLTPPTSHREYWRKGVNGARLPTATSFATPTHPCDLGSTWRTVSFIENDSLRLLEKNLRVKGDGPYQLELNGIIRTITDNFTITSSGYSNYEFDSNFDYVLCAAPEDKVGGILYIELENGKCVEALNPMVNLDGYQSNDVTILDLDESSLDPVSQWWNEHDTIFSSNKSLHNESTYSTICQNLPSMPTLGGQPIYGKLANGNYLIFDPRIEIESNTLTAPLIDGGKESVISSGGEKYCSNAPRTFLNENQCQLASDGCQMSLNDLINIPLDNSTIAAINGLSGRYMYAIKGLLVTYDGIALDHPCTPGLRSRWELKTFSDCNPTLLYDQTNSSIFQLLLESVDQNPYIRDIHFPTKGLQCDPADTHPEIELEVNGQCWKRVHDEHLSIFDLWYWVFNHPGGAYAITKWSENDGTFLIYPSLLERQPHGMANWNNNWQKFSYIGRYGDEMQVGDLPRYVRTHEVTNYFASGTDNDVKRSVLVCGSPGEVSNDKDSEHLFDPRIMPGFKTFPWQNVWNRQYVWLMIALGASDQFRQRVAWSFAQILIVVEDAITSEIGHSERFMSYYDIFTRNAFGNYRDILKEISFNPLMAENLSFLGSKSSAYMLERYKVKTSADFAREMMQLFTIGLFKLNIDGTPKLDATGNKILSYTNDDIVSLSRAWTGFDLQSLRGNIEGWENPIDPMKIVPTWRDKFPKTHTTNGYIGDKYPLCNDFPSKSFLKKGATYRFLAGSRLPDLTSDPPEFQDDGKVDRVELDEGSHLRSVLCDVDENGDCKFKNSVTLSTNLNCTAIECNVDTVRVVQVGPDAFFEYVSPPCVNMAFFNNARKLSPRFGTDPSVCANPELPVASEACCELGDVEATRNALYSGERMTFETAKTRCRDITRDICVYRHVGGDYHLSAGYFWTDDICLIQVKIRSSDGYVSIVHLPSDYSDPVGHINSQNQNYFKVYWERSGTFPSIEDDCDNVCEVLAEGACLCNTKMFETTVFRDMPSSVSELEEKLFIGAVNPEVLEGVEFSSIEDTDTNITAYLKNNRYDVETIFEYTDDTGRKFFMKNSKSSVFLRGIRSGFTGQAFRNAPHFMSFIPSETDLRDAQYETEAVLDHYFYHENTAPFISKLLIQRLISSNPSPRYVGAVANAFKSGQYERNGVSFGTGTYGDLKSTFAAIYLDNEARDVLLDNEVSTGSLREPIMKVTAVFRSMEFQSDPPLARIDKVMETIGQIAHKFTTVFSFFAPDYKPHGRVGNAELVSPEATLLIMPKILGLLNGLTSLVRYGLTSCGGGWSYAGCLERKYKSSDSSLQFNKPSTTENFAFETFEGPSLVGGLDNTWVGLYFNSHIAVATLDPVSTGNHVVHFPQYAYNGQFFSLPIVNDNRLVVKFRFLGLGSSPSGGCIGYVDASTDPGHSQQWALCDRGGKVMTATGQWISCQFAVPLHIQSFRIVVGDTLAPGGNAYFDDIQLGSNGDTTTCQGVEITKFQPPGSKNYSTNVVNKLATLLTAGRLSQESRDVIVNEFDKAGSAIDGLRIAQQLILTTAEFHTTNIVKTTSQPRERVTFPKRTEKPYRAVVYLMLNGGCDSFNMLAPHTCSNGLYESYLDVRQQVAIPKHRLLSIRAENQVCSEFGVHPDLPAIKKLYNDEDIVFFANTGVLSQPVNKENYHTLTNMQLFAHNHMIREAKRVDPYETNTGTGVLGRMTDVLSRNGHEIGSFSVDGLSVALVGKPGVTKAPVIVGRRGVPALYLDETSSVLPKLHNESEIESGIFAETWSSSMMEAIEINELLRAELDGKESYIKFPDTFLGNSLETISKLIKTRDKRGVDTDTFYIESFGFDTHADVEERLSKLFLEINDAFEAFSNEMKAQYIWHNVTLIQLSDFARTLSPNGGDGTDHAWGGNYIMMGGSVKGGQVLGKYPENITDAGPLTLKRGRMIPTTPWEGPFKGIASWLNIADEDMDEIFPNLHKFNSTHLLEDEEMFGPILVPAVPSASPSIHPTNIPTKVSNVPTQIPSIHQVTNPPTKFTSVPSTMPSSTPSPSSEQSSSPSHEASTPPSLKDTTPPSSEPSSRPSQEPSSSPSLKDTTPPSSEQSSSPSHKPSASQSSQPSEDPCIGDNNYPFKMLMTPDSTKPRDVYFHVRRRDESTGGFDQFVFRSAYKHSNPNQEALNCFNFKSCYKVMVFSRSGNGIGNGSFEAFWRGDSLSFDSKYTPIAGGESKIESEIFGKCPVLPLMPSAEPSNSHLRGPSASPSATLSAAPSIQPSSDPCAKANHDNFKIIVTPDSSNFADLYVFVLRRPAIGGVFDDGRVAFRKLKFSKSPNQMTEKCIWARQCLKAVLYSKSGNGIGNGSFEAYWQGNRISFNASFTPITTGDKAGQSKMESETFGRCATFPPTPSENPSVARSSSPSLSIAPSIIPTLDPCGLKANEDPFRLYMSPDLSIHDKANYIQMVVQKRLRKEDDSTFSDDVYSLRKLNYWKKADQLKEGCMWIKLCYKVVIYSYYDAATGIGSGSFVAYWNDNLLSFPAGFVSISDRPGYQSKIESETFGSCS